MGRFFFFYTFLISNEVKRRRWNRFNKASWIFMKLFLFEFTFSMFSVGSSEWLVFSLLELDQHQSNLPDVFCRERPAAIPINIKSIDDTSNFDEFPDSDILTPAGMSPRLDLLFLPLLWWLDWLWASSLLSPSVTQVSNQTEADLKNKDWVFINYTYKRFEGLTARGAIPSYMKSGKRWICNESSKSMPPEWWGTLYEQHSANDKGLIFIRCYP